MRRKVTERDKADRAALVARIKVLNAGGMSLAEAVEAEGITIGIYHYYLRRLTTAYTLSQYELYLLEDMVRRDEAEARYEAEAVARMEANYSDEVKNTGSCMVEHRAKWRDARHVYPAMPNHRLFVSWPKEGPTVSL